MVICPRAATEPAQLIGGCNGRSDPNLAQGGGATEFLFAFGALIALLAGVLLSLAPAAADEHLAYLQRPPDNFELVLGLAGDSDNIVRAGQELTVQAALRYTVPRSEAPFDPYLRWIIPQGSDSELRVGGGLAWETAASSRLRLARQANLNAVGFESFQAPDGNLMAIDDRTIVVRGVVEGRPALFIMDAWNKKLAGSVRAPAGAHSHFGHGNPHLSHPHISSGIGVWHETDSTAWMFVASPRDTVDGLAQVGRVYVYRLDWGDREVEATLETTLEPPATEVQNRWTATGDVWYSSALALSGDGSTLVVAAELMNGMGAAYVYTRPDGPGEDWGDVRYADGVKVTPVAIPSRGSSAANAPFTPSSTGRTGAATDCDAYCSRAHSMLVRNVEFGARHIAISADGRVMAVGAVEKNHPFETPGGSFGSGTYQRTRKGEIYVFVAPEGGWNAAPRADQDAQGNAKTLIKAKADARSFDSATHYSPGPLRRITEPDAVLVERLWTSAGSTLWLGGTVAVSPDGTLVYGPSATAGFDWSAGEGHIFQQSSVAGWQALNGGYMTPTGRIDDTGAAPNWGYAHFSPDNRSLVLAFRTDTRLAVIRRPAAGWSGVDVNQNTSPEVARRSNSEVAWPDTYNGSRAAFGDGANIYLSDGGCTAEVADGLETVTCPITLADATVVVPEGTPEGTFTISGQVTVQQENAADSKVTLRDELQVRIGDVAEVAEARLGLANDWRGTTDTVDDRPYPSLIEQGGKTRLRLQILNGSGTASGTGSVTSVIVTTTLGGLTSLVENGACVGASAGATRTTCAIPASALTSDNSDELLLELSHTGTAGAALVWATVAGKQGETLTTERVAIDLTGAPTALAITEPTATLLGYAPTDSADPRNKTTLVVSASDASGNRASVPDTVYSAKLTDSDGETIALTGANRKAEVVWPLRENDADDSDPVLSDGNPQARVTILAGAASPLAIGEYTLELSAGSGANKLTAAQIFNVAGGAAELELGADSAGEIAEGATVTFTAMVRDASGGAVPDGSGGAVPDGTPVSFSEQSTSSGAVLVLLSSSRQLTSGGQASIQAHAVGRGGGYVQATADNVSDIRTIVVVAAPAPSLSELGVGLAIDSFSIWPYARSTTAAALYEAMAGVAQLSKWDGEEWLSYGETNGLLNPGSLDFEIARGTVLWLTGE